MRHARSARLRWMSPALQAGILCINPSWICASTTWYSRAVAARSKPSLLVRPSCSVTSKDLDRLSCRPTLTTCATEISACRCCRIHIALSSFAARSINTTLLVLRECRLSCAKAMTSSASCVSSTVFTTRPFGTRNGTLMRSLMRTRLKRNTWNG